MRIQVKGASENNLKNINVDFTDELTVVTGISGSGKSSLIFSCLYHEARRRFLDVFSKHSSARLAPAKVHEIIGLGPMVAIEQNVLNRNPHSTLASASGLHPFLRLLYTHFGERRCHKCESKILILSEDSIVAQLVNFHQNESFKIFVPIVQNVLGSHSTLLNFFSEEFGNEQIYFDGNQYKIPFKQIDPTKGHTIELNIANVNKNDGNFSALDFREIVKKVKSLGSSAIKIVTASNMTYTYSLTTICSYCGTWLREIKPLHFHTSCSHCNGKGCNNCNNTGLYPEAAAIYWKKINFTELLELSVNKLYSLIKKHDLPSTAARLVYEIERRLDALLTVGLGYLTLNRSSPSLSRGESQRVRLAIALTSRIEDILHVLDEPTIGLSVIDTQKLLPAFRELAGPVIFVEHDRIAVAVANRVIDLGPGAGIQGGEVVFEGTPSALWDSDTLTGRYFSSREEVIIPQLRQDPEEFLHIKGANLRNLQNIDVSLPIKRLTVITGPSGSGKSTLVEDVLYASLTKKTPHGCIGLSKNFSSLKSVIVDQNPIGKNPRSNPATYTKLAINIRDIFADLTDLTHSHFSFNRPEGACSECKGMGANEVKMRYLPSTWIPCNQCMQKRFTTEVLEATVKFGEKEYSIADIYDLTVDEIIKLIPLLPKKNQLTIKRILHALRDIGLGYLKLGQPSPTLSGGEAQRVKLAKYLGMKSLSNHLLILDEPSTGLSPYDIAKLLSVLDQLVWSGATIIVVEHNPDFIRSADWIIDLGPGAGPMGGKLMFSGPLSKLKEVTDSDTVKGLFIEKTIRPESEHSNLPMNHESGYISIEEASVHNLKKISCTFPKGSITVVTGVSGSGKSSLISNVLKSEAERRFLETLSLYEREGIKEEAEPEVKSIKGLGVTIEVAPKKIRGWYNYRSTVGLITEISNHLMILYSALGEYKCSKCGSIITQNNKVWYCQTCDISIRVPNPRFFSSSNYSSACTHCNGVGTIQIPKPEKLIINPDKPICNGAMYSPGFFPKGYLCKRYNGGYYFIQALGKRYNFDPMLTPWNKMKSEAQNSFLFGYPETLKVTFESKKQGQYTRKVHYPGFYGWIRDWDVGGTYTTTELCPKCKGAKLRNKYLAVKLKGYNIHELSEAPLLDLHSILKRITHQLAESDIIWFSYQKTIQRIEFLIQVGLSYINLSRYVWSLSAGEAQRIKLASLLGSGLTSLTVLIDEPTRGLHPSENETLLSALKTLRDEGNTIIIVEHDLQIIKGADKLIDLGPGPGVLGGEIVAEGSLRDVANSNSITGRWLSGKENFNFPKKYRTPQGWLKLFGASENNLKGNLCEIPLGVLVGICGVSGSGKSSLIIDTLSRIIVPKKQTTSVAYEPIQPGKYESIEGPIPKAMIIDQSRKQVYSPLTFFGLRKSIMSIFAKSDDAMELGIDEKQFSIPCSACKGRGIIKIDMTFLPDVYNKCETCNGSGLIPEVMDIRVKGYTLPELYDLTLNQVYQLFNDMNNISLIIKAAIDVGLGYLVLNQPSFTLSGGECQRMKIAKELSKKIARKSQILYILDEPTIGQHLEDVKRLIDVLTRLVKAGNSVIIIEHHPHVLAFCDWLIEIGPVGGSEGGYIIATGTPNDIIKSNTPTSKYISEVRKGKL